MKWENEPGDGEKKGEIVGKFKIIKGRKSERRKWATHKRRKNRIKEEGNVRKKKI